MRDPAPLRHLPTALLVLLPALLLLPALFGDRALTGVHTGQLSPWRAETESALLEVLDRETRPLQADKTLVFQPMLEVGQQRLRDGEMPLWNPDLLCGVPLHAQAVHGLFSPTEVFVWWMPPLRAWAWVAWLQTSVAGLGMFALLRALGAGRWPACLAGLCFAFSGYFAQRAQWFQIQGSSIWLPLALLGVLRVCSGARWRGVTLTALAVGASLLAGFPQASLITLYACGALLAVRCAPGLLSGRASERTLALRDAAAGGAALLLGLALGAPQFLPSAELAASPELARRPVPPAVAATLGMTPATLATAVVPDLFGRPEELSRHATPQLRGQGVLGQIFLKPGSNAVEIASSISLVGLLLALLGLAARARGRGLGAALLGAGLLFAVDSPLLPALLHLPGLSTGDPRRFLLLVVAGGALLAGLGLERVLGAGPPRWFTRGVCAAAVLALLLAGAAWGLDADTWSELVVPPLASTLGVPEAEVAEHAADFALDLDLLQHALLRCALFAGLCAGGLLLARRWRAPGAALLLAAASLDLLGAATAGTTLLPAAGYEAPPPGLALLLDDDGGRLHRFHPGPPVVLEYPLPPGPALRFGVRDVSGYLALTPRRVALLADLVQPGTGTEVGLAALSDPEALSSPLLDAMAVTRVLSSVPLEQPGLSLLGRVGSAWLYRNEGALPRVFVAAAVQPVADEAGARAVLAAPGFDPRLLTVVETGAAGPTRAGPWPGPVPEANPAATHAAVSPPDSDAARRAVRVLRDEPEHVEVQCTLPEAGTLVLADAFMTGWSATLDGRPAALLPANLAFRAVDVPAGTHVVAFRYRSQAWELGSWMGLGAALVVAVCAMRAWSSRARSRSSSIAPATAERRDATQ